VQLIQKTGLCKPVKDKCSGIRCTGVNGRWE
jgi:hypothetical protein